MPAGYIALDIWDLVLAALLIFINGVLSLTLRLGLERMLLVATIRMVVQLAAVGLVLTFIFSQTSPLWTLALGLLMVAFAGREVMARQTRRFRGWLAYGLGAGPLLLVGLLAALYGVGALIGPEPWYSPRFVLPILGM
ncbi:MAG: ABC transporter permease, partial [Alphaproteobacteria bacterium]